MDFNYLTTVNIAMVLGIIGLGTLAYRYSLSTKKSDTRKVLGFIGTVSLVIALLPAFTPISVLIAPLMTPSVDGGAGGGGAGGGGTGSGGTGTVCAVDEVTLKIQGSDAYNGTGAGTTHRYWKNDDPSATLSDGGTTTASPGDKVNVLFENGAPTIYSGAYKTGVEIPCKSPFTITEKLYRNSSLTFQIKSEDDGLQISDVGVAPVTEALTTGDTVSLSTIIKGTFERGFPNEGIVICQYDIGTIDDCIVELGGSVTSVPTIAPLTNATYTRKAYTVPPILSNQEISGQITLKAKSNSEPHVGVSNVSLYYYPQDYFVNEDKGGIVDGPAVQDEDTTKVGTGFSIFVIGVA